MDFSFFFKLIYIYIQTSLVQRNRKNINFDQIKKLLKKTQKSKQLKDSKKSNSNGSSMRDSVTIYQ